MSELEKLLISKSKAGDTDAFEKLVGMHDKKAYNIALRIMGNEEDAKDMSQEALIRVYRSIRDFKEQSSFSTWLYRIVTNVCLDELRKRKNAKTVPVDGTIETEDGEMHLEVGVEHETPEEVYVKQERKKVILNAISELNEEHRSAIVLRDIQGFSYEEIAAMLDLSLGTVKSRINRARHALKDKLSVRLELSRQNGV